MNASPGMITLLQYLGFKYSFFFCSAVLKWLINLSIQIVTFTFVTFCNLLNIYQSFLLWDTWILSQSSFSWTVGVPRRARKAQCYLLDLPRALGSTRWLNPRAPFPSDIAPWFLKLPRRVCVPAAVCWYNSFQKQVWRVLWILCWEKTLWDVQNFLREWQLQGIRSQLRLNREERAGPFPLIHTPFTLVPLALLACPSVWAGSVPLKSLHIPYKPQRRRKGLSVLSVPLDWS